MSVLEYSRVGLALTEHFESSDGPNLQAYFDKFASVWTIGYGHAGHDVHQGLIWSLEQCITALEHDVAWASKIVNRFVTVPINQNQFDALVDFCFNVGAGNFAKSTLLQLVNASKFQEADEQFARWIHSGGKVAPGLIRRRAAEAQLFAKVIA